MADKLCGICGVTIDGGSGTINGIRHCKSCCAEYTRQEMIKTGRATLYMVFRPDSRLIPMVDIRDFLGGLLYHVEYIKKSHHNISGKRFDSWFNGPDGHVWHAYRVMMRGDICHCKRTKEVWHPWKAEVIAAL